MIRVTGFVHLDPAAAPATRDELLAAIRGAGAELNALSFSAAPTEDRSHRAGQLMVLAAFADLDAYRRARDSPYLADVVRPLLETHAAHVEIVRYEQGPVVVAEPHISGIQRTLLIHVDPAADPAAVAEFTHQLASMGCYIDAIRNYSLSRVDEVWGGTGRPWTHVWEQEFRTLDGLTGPYLTHAHHWAVVDTWFDPQAPNHIVDTTLVHAMCVLERSILALGGPE
jgi:Stress responsive A/B Barrel Domain